MLQMDIENIGSASGTGGVPKDDERSAFTPGVEELGDQSANASESLAALGKVEQKLTSDCDKITDEIVTNGEKADDEVVVESKSESDQNGQMTSESRASKEKQASQLDTSETETGVEKPGSESGEQKTHSDAKLAASVKENDVSDECLAATPPQEDEWMDILGNGQLKKKVNP